MRSATTCAPSSASARTTTSTAPPARGEAVRAGWQTSRAGPSRADAGVIGRCLRERRPVIVGRRADARPTTDRRRDARDVRSELVVPLWVGGELWGAINIEETRRSAFDEDDARLVQTVADQIGSALRSATLYERLERAYLGTAEAPGRRAGGQGLLHGEPLARGGGPSPRGRAAGSAWTASSCAPCASAAIFHDIGKIAVPEAILNKRGPLTAARAARDRAPYRCRRAHPLDRRLPGRRAAAGAPRARALGRPGLPRRPVRRGHPAGLAHHPRLRRLRRDDHRPALPGGDVREPAPGPSCCADAGAQFDERVVAALLQVLEAEAARRVSPLSSDAR